MATKRTAIVLIPNFAMAVFAKTQRSRAHGAIALADTIDDIAPVMAINETAAKAGITCGMTTSQAQAFCPGLMVYQRDLVAERAEAQAIAGWLGALSPTVHEEVPGRYRLDASGMMLLYRDETAYAEKILTTLRPLGYTLQVGLAKNPFVAQVAAERAEPDGYLIIPAHTEKAFLSSLEREYLEMSDDTASLLHDLGIEQIAQVSAFPINEMTARFGREGHTLVTLARGENPEEKRQVRAPDATGARRVGALDATGDENQFTATRFFSAPLDQARYLRRHINQLLGDLLVRLKSFGQGCACVEIKLHLDNHTEQLVSLMVEKPTASVRLFLRQWQIQSEMLTLAGGITGITVTIPHLRPLLIEQMALGDHRAQSTGPAELPDTVYRPCLRPGILPESRFELLPYASSKKRSGFSSRRNGTSEPDLQNWSLQAKRNNHLWQSVGLRLLQPPRTVRVHLENNRPVDIIWAGRHRTIIRAAGPWELSGRWWQAGFHRRYYEIIVDTRQRYLVFCEHEDAGWFMQGVYD